MGRLASGFVFCSCSSIGEACQPNAVVDDRWRVGHWRVWGNQHVAYTRAAVTSGASPLAQVVTSLVALVWEPLGVSVAADSG